MSEPFEIEDGARKLLLHTNKWGTALSLWWGSGCISHRLTADQMLALAMALTERIPPEQCEELGLRMWRAGRKRRRVISAP